ncbi:MAG: hypothetical protein MCS20_00940 [Candidatus Phytoplasma mali]|nr:hypothetical protein [Candidatus Phytoplasma australiense]MCG7201967.1 hypothetical protein [Candidatus Phytoplasma mali]
MKTNLYSTSSSFETLYIYIYIYIYIQRWVLKRETHFKVRSKHFNIL